MSTFAEYQEAAVQEVAEIARTLDEVKPGWAARVGPLDLDMMDGRLCIAGQVFDDEAASALPGEFWSGFYYAVVHPSGPLHQYDQSSALANQEYVPLWTAEIEKRLAVSV